MRTRGRVVGVIGAIAPFVPLIALAASPPPELVELERQVSLQIAHVRDGGPTDPVKRKQLLDAEELEEKGEAAIKSADYKSAQEILMRARAIVRQLLD